MLIWGFWEWCFGGRGAWGGVWGLEARGVVGLCRLDREGCSWGDG